MKITKEHLKRMIMEEMSSTLLEGPRGLQATDVQQVKSDHAAQAQLDPADKPGQASLQASEIRPELMAMIQTLSSAKGIDNKERKLVIDILNILASAAQNGQLTARAGALYQALKVARVTDMAGR
jgi:hypothetical protein